MSSHIFEKYALCLYVSYHHCYLKYRHALSISLVAVAQFLLNNIIIVTNILLILLHILKVFHVF